MKLSLIDVCIIFYKNFRDDKTNIEYGQFSACVNDVLFPSTTSGCEAHSQATTDRVEGGRLIHGTGEDDHLAKW